MCGVIYDVIFGVIYDVMCGVIYDVMCGVIYGVICGVIYDVIFGVIYDVICGVIYDVIFGVIYDVMCGVIYGVICGVIYDVIFGVIYDVMCGVIYGVICGVIYMMLCVVLYMVLFVVLYMRPTDVAIIATTTTLNPPPRFTHLLPCDVMLYPGGHLQRPCRQTAPSLQWWCFVQPFISTFTGSETKNNRWSNYHLPRWFPTFLSPRTPCVIKKRYGTPSR